MNEKIEEYYKMIYKVMNDLHCSTDDEMQDEMFFNGLMGLYNGIKTFDKEKNAKESTYYYICIRNAILTQYCYNSRVKRDRINTISLDETIYGQTELKDIIASDVDIEREIIKNEKLNYLCDVLNKAKNNKFKQYLCDFYGIGTSKLNLKQIASKYGVSVHNVSSSLRQGIGRLRKKVLKEYERKNK